MDETPSQVSEQVHVILMEVNGKRGRFLNPISDAELEQFIVHRGMLPLGVWAVHFDRRWWNFERPYTQDDPQWNVVADLPVIARRKLDHGTSWVELVPEEKVTSRTNFGTFDYLPLNVLDFMNGSGWKSHGEVTLAYGDKPRPPERGTRWVVVGDEDQKTPLPMTKAEATKALSDYIARWRRRGHGRTAVKFYHPLGTGYDCDADGHAIPYRIRDKNWPLYQCKQYGQHVHWATIEPVPAKGH